MPLPEPPPLPLAVALLSHPGGTYAFMVLALVCLARGIPTRSPVASFAGVSAALLAALGCLHVQPGAPALALLAIGVVLLHAEFVVATHGLAGIAGFAAAAWGSWAILGAGHAPLPGGWRLLAALAGTAVLALCVAHALRRATLAPPH